MNPSKRIEKDEEHLTAARVDEPRYILTRMIRDRMVPRRYQRSGWMAFDRTHQQHGQIWPTKKEAQEDVTRLNRRQP